MDIDLFHLKLWVMCTIFLQKIFLFILPEKQFIKSNFTLFSVLISHTGKKGLFLLVAGMVVSTGSSQEIPLTDTISNITLHGVTISTFRPGTILSSHTPFQSENLTKIGLQKMACCNLSESFENSASVTVGYTDAVSGARQIQLLGLSGIYSQLLAENVPVFRGLASPFGLNYIPTSWLESIQISKGSSSVINGYESITGQMNLEFKKPNFTEPLFLNLYVNDQLHYEGNITSAAQVSEKLWTSLLWSGTWGTDVHDGNKDNFLDMPKIKYATLFNRWFYLNDEKNLQSRTGIRFLYEERMAGQDSLCFIKHGIPFEGLTLWESRIENKNVTVDNKTGFSIGNKTGQSLGIINTYSYHTLHSHFGLKTWRGTQHSYSFNVLFNSFVGNTNHRYSVGTSYQFDRYTTEYEDRLEINSTASYLEPSAHTPLTCWNRTESVPGIFGEYTGILWEKLTAVVGFRADYHNRYGWLYTPRMNLKYDLTNNLIFRISAGKGYHNPLVLTENLGLMASSRNLEVDHLEELKIEEAWNLGGNMLFTFPVWGGRTAKLSVDYYYTRFKNQIQIDTERNRNAVFFYNSEGSAAYAHAGQADLSMTLLRGLELFAAFRYNFNQIEYTDDSRRVKKEKPLVSRYRGLINLSYATNLRRWVCDVTAQLNGPSRLPGLNGYDSEDIYSPGFPVYYVQITRNSKRFDLYAGAENLFGYTQKDPVRNGENPFGKDFDASMVWGPLTGTRLYAGLRMRIGNLY